MSQNQVILQFRFATFGDSMLQKMNLLRHQRRFCDVTQDSREVQISMIQEAEVGRQLLLSCYTGQLEFPELELVHYLTVASFLQMGHIVEQCTEALSKFIKPARKLEVEVRREKEEGLSKREQEVRTVHQNKQDDEEDDRDDDDVIIQPISPSQILSRCPKQQADVDIAIVKVESVSDEAENSSVAHFPRSPPPALHSPEPQHSLINSTVDSRCSETAAPPGCRDTPSVL
ncbi:hypothetical protein KUCAC02_027854 [Chaenocephalus aceratus]|nr:hypothetical protein KUCAC02_027854 [Chaenocephalus aceratus]